MLIQLFNNNELKAPIRSGCRYTKFTTVENTRKLGSDNNVQLKIAVDSTLCKGIVQ